MLLILIFLICLSGLCSAIHVAFFSLSPVDLKVAPFLSSQNRQYIERLLAAPRDLLVTLLLCDVSANILVQQAVVHLFGTASSWVITVGLPIVLTVFLGEIIPKSLGLPFRLRVAAFTAPLVMAINRLLQPIGRPISKFTNSLSHILFSFLKPNQQPITEEVSYLLNLSKEGGVLSASEANWLTHYLSLSEQMVKERMHPREELVFYNIYSPLSQLAACFKKSSEVVICKDDLQNVLGILKIGDYIFNIHTDFTASTLLQYLYRPFFIPESLSIISLFNQMLNSPTKLCLVVDEYGVISGWITKSDLMRFVLHHPKQPLVSHEPLVVSGKMELEEFYQLFQKKLSSVHNVATLAGWMIERLGEIPKPGVILSDDGFVFEVLEADSKKVKQISIKRQLV